ncbi:ABC-F family ATP-binding cassette domain-containing protein [Paludisphaera mucosa]|uniref:ABC-F family ATP-binding cassette domain-containing protein n=1 Tax=Paludisphaera mucosa TaxID=3030827 RepID=A0ABT6F7C5_9BACT|nr:ABC-F family ATP-binding cassette domain-containing protein [Paludisphaera mucosa]MDG3003386.1 ABC-F family ATP-binding cassette domain-containing protein [Paludisphaera mucosa]
MILISAQGLGRQYAGDPIFTDLAFEVRAGERIGLVGPNGAGKTTLMKLLDRTEQPEYGQVHTRAGVRVSLLRQQPDFAPDQTLMDVARQGLASLLDLQRELEEAAQEMAEAEDEADRQRAGLRYDQIHEQIIHQDAYDVDYRVEEILSGLGFVAADHDRPALTFSGGQQSRLMLAKLLLESPDLMLLDEPSNHLDIETTEWLENYLSRQPVAMIVVSHDRYFLDKIVTKIWELNEGTLESYPGNYTQYWNLRAERAKVLERQAERFEEKTEKLEAYIRKYGAGQRAKQAHDRERKLDKLQAEKVETIRDIVGPVMKFEEVDRSGDIVIQARELSKAYDKPLFSGLNLSVERGQCVGVIGPNGAGKTTLLKTLIGRELPDSGEVKLGHRVSVGYHDQGLQSLDYDTTVIRAVWPEDDTDWVEGDVRSLLARFGLTGDQAFRKVGKLSGGEKAKAALARLCATGANLLVMDEPTNHLDIWSCDALERSIRDFEGTVLVVSHDRYFLNKVADRILVVADGKVKVIEGDYEAYQALMQRGKEAEKAKPAAAAPPPPPTPRPAPAAANGKSKNKKKFSYRPAVELEKEIAQTEAEVADLEDKLGQPATWRDPGTAVRVQDRHVELKEKLETLFQHWEFAIESEW